MDRLNDPQSAIAGHTRQIEPHLVEIRRDLHAHPELAFQEVRTAGVVAAELGRLGIPHQTGVGGTGVVGTITGGQPGPTLAIRADMDALPIHEQTGLPFASQVDGLMHACGHDIHTTTLVGVAEVLQRLAPQLRGTVKLIFQPAEETGAGAAAMIAEGALTGVDFALGFHNHPDMPTGQFAYVRGATLAAVDSFDITVHGRSGHAAYPHTTIDPIIAAANLVVQLQTVVSREIPPMRPAVVTVGAIQGGSVRNIIPDACVLRGTVRTLHPEARDLAELAIRRLCAGVEEGMRVRVEVAYNRTIPSCVNDDGMVDRGVASVRAQMGDVISAGEASLGGEDFAYMAELVPSLQLRIGSGAPGRNDKLHNSGYQPDEACLGMGVQALSRVALEMLS
jgi:amidohydrolase